MRSNVRNAIFQAGGTADQVNQKPALLPNNMTREEIIRFVIEASLQETMESYGLEKLEHFARLIAGAEQERCFNVCGQVEGPAGDFSFYEGVRACANALYAVPEE